MQQRNATGAPATLLARLLPTGQLDASFSTTLLAPATPGANWFGAGGAVTALALQPDGALVVGGTCSRWRGSP